MKVFVIPYIEKYMDQYIQAYKEYKHYFRDNSVKLALAFDRIDLAEENFKTIIEEVAGTIKHGVGPKNIVVTFFNNFSTKVFSKEELNRLRILREGYKNMGIDVRVYDYKDAYTIEEVESASQQIVDLANQINMLKLSPLENLLYAYLMVSDRDYKLEKDGDTPSKSRSLYSILNNDEICCAGYSTYLKTLADQLHDPNVKVFCNLVASRTPEDPFGFHQNNIVYLKDEKYDIDGFFYLDPTWDSDKIEYLEQIKLNFFMIPINEIKNIGGNISDYLSTFEDYILDLKEKEEKEKEEAKVDPADEENSGANERRVRNNTPVSNLSPPIYSSIAKSTFKLEILKKYSKYSEESLYSYLSTREDFKNFSIRSYLKINKKRFKAANVQKSYWYSKRYPSKFFGQIGIKKMWKFMNQNTQYIDMSQILGALRHVIKENFPEYNKDEISKLIFDIAQTNIEYAKYLYKSQSQAPFPIAHYKVSNALPDKDENAENNEKNEGDNSQEPTGMNK